MQKAAPGSTDRIAATFYSATEYTVDLNLTDGKMHRVALYCLDWDGNNTRAQRLEVRDAVQWLVTDHLGTPRMVADLTGSLAGIKRHDYLPFGGEGRLMLDTVGGKIVHVDMLDPVEIREMLLR